MWSMKRSEKVTGASISEQQTGLLHSMGGPMGLAVNGDGDAKEFGGGGGLRVYTRCTLRCSPSRYRHSNEARRQNSANWVTRPAPKHRLWDSLVTACIVGYFGGGCVVLGEQELPVHNQHRSLRRVIPGGRQ